MRGDARSISNAKEEKFIRARSRSRLDSWLLNVFLPESKVCYKV